MRPRQTRTLEFSSALSRAPCNLPAFLRAIQNSDESPTIAPSAPANMTLSRSRLPSAASVEAAFSVVSAGKIGTTASNQTSRKQMT